MKVGLGRLSATKLVKPAKRLLVQLSSLSRQVFEKATTQHHYIVPRSHIGGFLFLPDPLTHCRYMPEGHMFVTERSNIGHLISILNASNDARTCTQTFACCSTSTSQSIILSRVLAAYKQDASLLSSVCDMALFEVVQHVALGVPPAY